MKKTIKIRGKTYISSAVLCRTYEIHGVTAYRWRKRGLLPEGVRIGNVHYYPKKEVECRMSRGESS
jgi:hypothetical protein